MVLELVKAVDLELVKAGDPTHRKKSAVRLPTSCECSGDGDSKVKSMVIGVLHGEASSFLIFSFLSSSSSSLADDRMTDHLHFLGANRTPWRR